MAASVQQNIYLNDIKSRDKHGQCFNRKLKEFVSSEAAVAFNFSRWFYSARVNTAQLIFIIGSVVWK